MLYLQESAENLPEELAGIVNEVHVLFPWGSLLRGIAAGDAEILANIKRICSKDAILRTMFALDQNKNHNEIRRLGLTDFSMEYIENVLIPRYSTAGFDVIEKKLIPFSESVNLPTSWAKRLQHNRIVRDSSLLQQPASGPQRLSTRRDAH